MKILNLYAGIGGNRKLWGDNHEVTAIELNPEIAAIYKKLHPNDTVIVDDAHEYLLKNFYKYDFIWASPPCPSHSRARFWGANNTPIYPEKKYGYNLSGYKINKNKILRNCVDPKIGLHIINCALNNIQQKNITEFNLWS